MPMLTAADVADLRDIFTDAQVDHELILSRYNTGTAQYDDLAAQGVQVALGGQQAALGGDMPGVQTLRAPLTFYRESPFDVAVGDLFDYDGHKGGRINRVYTDPVLGVIAAESSLDEGR